MQMLRLGGVKLNVQGTLLIKAGLGFNPRLLNHHLGSDSIGWQPDRSHSGGSAGAHRGAPGSRATYFLEQSFSNLNVCTTNLESLIKMRIPIQ